MSSLLTNLENVQFWREIYPYKQGIILLEQYLTGMAQTLLARRHIYQTFRQNGDLFFEGLATMSGFGCEPRLALGNDCIRIAALSRHCPEALNYLGLAYYAQNFVDIAVQLFNRAAVLGHTKANGNLDFVRAALQQKVPRAQIILTAT